MADALNNRGIPGLRGGRWYASTIQDIDRRGARVLVEGRDWAETAVKLQAHGLLRTIRRLRVGGLRSYEGIARRLTTLDIPSPTGGAWTAKRVQRLEAHGERWTLETHPRLSKAARDKLIKILPIANDLQLRGTTDYREISEALNNRCITPPNNSKEWTRKHVADCLRLIAR
jgi:hypothetical protein